MNVEVHCREFAKVRGCSVKNSPNDEEVLFVKDAAELTS